MISFEITKKNFIKGLKAIKPALYSDKYSEMHGNIKLVYIGGFVYIDTFNDGVYASYNLVNEDEVRVVGRGEFILSWKTVFDIVNSARTSTIECSETIVSTGFYVDGVLIERKPYKMFYHWTEMASPAFQIITEGKDLKQAVKIATVFAEKEDAYSNNHDTQGVYFNLSSTRNLVVSALDGVRLVRTNVSLKQHADAMTTDLYVHTEFLKIFDSLSTAHECLINIVDRTLIVMQVPLTIKVKGIVPATPDRVDVVFKKNIHSSQTYATVNRDETVTALKAISVINTFIRLSVHTTGEDQDKISLFAQDTNQGYNVTCYIKGKTNGLNVDIAINADYLLDALKNMSEDNIVMWLSGPDNVMTVCGLDGKSEALIMPMRIYR